ncbi:MAG TPA: hypothetical protein VG737_14535 [Cyclobacteriaceae bacterium]|nr:hypothetical protein [Cyclobacteriaceae bacterium]
MRKICFFILLLPGFLQAQSKPDSTWNPVRFFIGHWTGASDGEPGKGSCVRSYQFVLNNQFIVVRNKATYPPQEKNPKGEVHEDVGYISFDRKEKVFVLRQFHKEGFVNEYKQESISADGKTISFLSYAIENIPIGWRARETYKIQSADQFLEIFELAEPGKEFQVYSMGTLRRKK